jgi:hypothetical protein
MHCNQTGFALLFKPAEKITIECLRCPVALNNVLVRWMLIAQANASLVSAKNSERA